MLKNIKKSQRLGRVKILVGAFFLIILELKIDKRKTLCNLAKDIQNTDNLSNNREIGNLLLTRKWTY